MKLRKIIFIAFLIQILLMCVFSCSGESQQTKTSPLPTPAPILPAGPTTSIPPISLKWESMNGPYSGKIFQLVQNPWSHNQLYALTSSGVYKSEDKGENWKLLIESVVSETNPIGTVNTMALYKDTLFTSGIGINAYESSGRQVKILDGWWQTIAVSDNKLFIGRPKPGPFGSIEMRVAELTSQQRLNWTDISPSTSQLADLRLPPRDAGFPSRMRVSNILSAGNRVIAGITVEVDGSGELTNGHLYVSEDSGKTWSRVILAVPKGVIVSNIVQNPTDPQHIFVLFRHPTLHDITFPISELVWESLDGGKTWRKSINSNLLSNGVTDVAIMGSTYYFLSPYDSYILRADGSRYDRMAMPRVKEFGNLDFNLDRLLIDYDEPSIVYGKAGSTWDLGLVKSVDRMRTWKKMDKGIVASSPTIIVPHPKDIDTILTTGNYCQDKYCTRDGGKSWEPFSQLLAVDEVRFDLHDPSHVFLITEVTDIFESYDTGKSFSRIANNFSSAKVFDFEIARDNPNQIYVSNSGIGISERLPSGEWLHLRNSPDYAYVVRIDPEDSNVIYATYSPKKFEKHSAIWRYSKKQSNNFGWTELFRFENTGGITSMEFDPANPNTIYAGITGKDGTVYVSRDRGKSWSKLNDQLTFTTVWGHSQLQIDPRDKKTVYAGTWGGGTYKSADGGKEWSLLDEAHTLSPTALTIWGKNPDIIYACDRTSPVIHRSNDAGKTWSIYYDFGKDFMLTSAVAIDPDNADLIYAAAFNPPLAHKGELAKIERGKKIADLTNGLPRSVLHIELDPKNPGVIYVTTHIHGVFKSTDGGKSWVQLDDKGTGLPRTGFYDIEVDPANSNILYGTALCGELPGYMLPRDATFKNLEGKCGVYKSTDSGANWALILDTVSEARGIEINPKNTENLYVADMMGGVWVSNDGGRNWKQENNGLGSTSMTSVKVKDDHIYAATQGSGVYAGVINSNGSITWDAARSNKPKALVQRIQVKVDPRNPNRIYASAYPGGLLRSDDSGKQWNDKNFLTPSIKVDDPTIQGYYSFDLNPQEPDTVWLGAYGKGMFVSLDGMDYDMFANGSDNIMKDKHVTAVAINPVNPQEIYVGSQEGIFRTRDSGRRWEILNTGLDNTDVRSLKLSLDKKSASVTAYAGIAGYGVYKLAQGSDRWQHLGRTLGIGWWGAWDRRMYQFSSIIFDPDVPGKVYLGHFPGGLFVSTDNGRTWKDSGLGLGNDGIFTMTMHPQDHNVLFAGTYNGVMKSEDKGRTWQMKSNGMPPEQWPYTVAIDSNNPKTMYVTTKNGQNKGFCFRNTFCGVVMKSIDGGETWSKIMNGLDDKSEFYTLLIYPDDHNILFLSTTKGVYTSKDAGRSWHDANNGLPTTYNWVRDNVAENLALTMDNKYLIYSIHHYGLWKADISSIKPRP